jgi:eukaryotic-like serine/threonine-protein kinase
VTAPAEIGPYRIERLLGAGSFATVWLGHDPALGAFVAIKILAENWSHDLRVRERFRDEGRLLWRLDHERVVRVYTVGELADGRPYLVMTWAEDGSLRDRLEAGPIPVPAALALLGEIAMGVRVLHDNGIVHRDLTPGNILFRGPGRVLIADLGLAKALAAASGLTARAGTPGYMAPEQDSPAAVVDRRTDVYALGRLAERLLTTGGRLRPGVPGGVAGVLRTATAHRPADRFPDAAAFAAALEVGGTAASARRHRVLGRRVLGGALAVALTAVLAADVAGTSPLADPTGHLRVRAPAGWRSGGAGWEGQRDAGGDRDPAYVVSPDPGRWLSDPGVPGAFLGLSRGIAAQTTPAEFVAGRHHTGCTAVAVRVVHTSTMDFTVAGYRACRGGKPVVAEAAAFAPGAGGLVYVQVAPPANDGLRFVDTLLAGVDVR